MTTDAQIHDIGEAGPRCSIPGCNCKATERISTQDVIERMATSDAEVVALRDFSWLVTGAADFVTDFLGHDRCGVLITYKLLEAMEAYGFRVTRR